MREVPLYPGWDGTDAAPVEGPECRGTSLIRNSALLGPYSRTLHRALWWP